MNFHLHLDDELVQFVPLEEPFSVDPCVPTREVFETLKQRRKGSILICEQGKLLGVFTERDALRLMAEQADLAAPIGDVMTKSPVTIAIDTTVGEAIRTMSAGGYRRLPVLDAQQVPVGIFKVSHIMNYLVSHFPSYIYNLPPKPHTATRTREGA